MLYRKHLCTFMGRENNLVILLKYIERALEIDAIDEYWMIDMTRCFDDHKYIAREQQRLNELYPGRVHLYNAEARAELLNKGDDVVKSMTGKWGTFYKFLRRFNDNDIIAKCDDDTLFIDVETLAAAYDFRWNNKQPYLIHANCINNGITAYYQKQDGIWDDSRLDMYPSSGLTGPLFSHPEIACDCHDKFTTEICESTDNINNYKLEDNKYFCQRVSINFIFMLGTDRDELSKIDEQDEYETSCKIPQRLDRPNMIVGGFTVAHHTYGVQEPVMEERGTYEKYLKLSNVIFDRPGFDANKNINSKYNPVSTIKIDDSYVSRYWGSDNKKIIKNSKTGKYLNLDHVTRERTIGPRKIQTGQFLTKSALTGADYPMSWIVCDNLIRTGAEIMKTTPHNKTAVRYGTHLVNIFYQGNYDKQTLRLIETKKGYVIEAIPSPGFYLSHIIHNNGKEAFMFVQSTLDEADKWDVTDQSKLSDTVVLQDIIRDTPEFVDNDHTYGTCKIPEATINNMTRGFYWMVQEYIWEFIKREDNVYIIKLIADDLNALYLGYSIKDDQLKTTSNPVEWVIVSKLKHKASSKYVNIDKNILTLSSSGVGVNISGL